MRYVGDWLRNLVTKWERLDVKDWPLWVLRSVNNDALHAAWDAQAPLIRRGRTFEYQVWPLCEDQGHWAIDRIYRRLKQE